MNGSSWLTKRGLATAGLAVLVSGVAGYGAARFTAAEMIKSNARLEAEHWAANVELAIASKTEALAGPLILAMLDHAAQHGQDLALQLDTAHGTASFSSGESSVYGAANSAALASSGTPAVELIWGAGEAPSIQSLVKTPVRRGQDVAGWLVLRSDQTSRYASTYNYLMAALAGMALVTLAAAGFGLAFHSRSMRHQLGGHDADALRDPLTGLPNKPALLLTIEQKLTAAAGEKRPGAIILCEAAMPLGVVQSFGEEAEVALVRAAAERLAAHAKGRYVTARTGRMTFGLLLLAGASDAMEVLALAKELTVKLGEPVEWHGQSFAVTAHAGIALATSDGETPEALLRSAELALHAAQEQGTPGYGFFNPEIAKDIRRQSAIQRAVSATAASQSFRLDYQPVYNIRTGELTGFEALIRMHDQELGAVSPAEFIPIAEQMGLINAIGAWCLQEACRTAAEWPPHLQVAVNLSPAQFMSGSLVSDVRIALEQARLPAYRLEVEITEGTLLNSSEAVLTQLRSLRDMGIAVALDDFGTGYSSLGYLWKFPFSKLKIDRSFVQALEESPSAKGILRSIVKLGHGLGLTVTAEGIETQKQFGVLRDLGCDLAQGFLLDRPARIADLAAIILRNFANGLHRRPRDVAVPDRTAA